MASHLGTQKGLVRQLVQIAALRKHGFWLLLVDVREAAKFGQICCSFTVWAKLKAVATRAGLFFIDGTIIPQFYTDQDEFIAGGLCDNLLTCIIRAWDYTKPSFVAPSMNAFLWRNPFTERHLMSLDELGIALIPPISTSHTGDHQDGTMALLYTIESAIKVY
ncbi:hypothetical protein ACJRO7_000694 [Eucalyptus globulus]|uniref:Uncharacterized protein n=1 Tax=Eucalyptus globulus TaxID=34317 RepID=A0ABD3LPP9_EUCGL